MKSFYQKIPLISGIFYCVAGLGVAPSLKDYEPFVQLYTTPHVVNEQIHFNINWGDKC